MTAVLSRMNDMPDTSDVTAYVNELGRRAATAARSLASASTERKNKALTAAAQALRDNRARLLEANAKDVDSVKAAGKPAAFIDRLILDEGRVNAIADALDQIATLPDPVGRVLHTTERPNGLTIERVATPLGVIGMIYESRPNVGADAGALCLKSGNAVILRGGSESLNSTRVIVECLAEGLKAADLPLECIQMIDTTDRNAVQALLTCAEYVDLVIPRGGKGLVSLVRDQARVPTLFAPGRQLPHLCERRGGPDKGGGDREKRQAAPDRRLRRDGKPCCGPLYRQRLPAHGARRAGRVRSAR